MFHKLRWIYRFHSNIPIRRRYLRQNHEEHSSRWIYALIWTSVGMCIAQEIDLQGYDQPNQNIPRKVLQLNRNFIGDAAEKALPSVVNITSNDHGILSGMRSGSGFIISTDGYIVTNAHVVSQAKDGKVSITMSNMNKKSGHVHSFDSKTDIALVKMDDISGSLPVASLGDSNMLRVGDFVVALGSPLHLQNTVTFGIVSALSRHGSELGMSKSANEFIQTDAAINVGNSGGPLVNLDGDVIGINVMKAQGVDGISFAIPINTAKEVIKQLRMKRKVVRPRLGIKLTTIAVKNSPTCVLVQDVEASSPAYQSGLKRLVAD